jgi:hypothetical protein
VFACVVYLSIAEKSNNDSDDDEPAEKQSDRRGSNSDTNDSTRVGLTRINALDLMKKGAPFLKYGRFGFPHFREFQLTEDNMRIVWFSSGKSLSDSSLHLRDIEEIRMGQATEIFAKYPAPELAAASMSLMYDNRERSLDIIAKTPYDFKVWSTALHGLVRKARECTDEQMHELREWPIDIRIEPTRVNRSMRYVCGVRVRVWHVCTRCALRRVGMFSSLAYGPRVFVHVAELQLRDLSKFCGRLVQFEVFRRDRGKRACGIRGNSTPCRKVSCAGTMG